MSAPASLLLDTIKSIPPSISYLTNTTLVTTSARLLNHSSTLLTTHFRHLTNLLHNTLTSLTLMLPSFPPLVPTILLLLISPLTATPNPAPTATTRNGTYEGLYSSTYNQDFFLGVPFAKPPVGQRRFGLPESLDGVWEGKRAVTGYYPHCPGYGPDQVGYTTNEDCLALNVIRPAGYEDQKLPVGVWIHGGGYYEGGTPDKRYNLSFIVENSVTIKKPIIAVSIAYRLSAFGFLDSQEIRAAGLTNIGIRDQRLALHWLQENIAGFGGDPSQVTIWGESAGAGSVGIHLIAYGGRDDKLFARAIGESGSPLLLGPSRYNVSIGQGVYDNITRDTGCSTSTNTLQCLRDVPFPQLNATLQQNMYSLFPYMDSDLIQGHQSTQLATGRFVKVPYLLGANTDEGSAFAPRGINTDTEFETYLNSTAADHPTVQTLQILYPDIPALGVLDTVVTTPPPQYGSQWKRAAAFAGDYVFIAGRRLTAQQWAVYNVSAYSYRFNVIVNPLSGLIGVTHFQEVAFVFDNTAGLGYEVNPFEGKPASYKTLARLMSCMWVAFIHGGDPNGHGLKGVENWPRYDNGIGGYGREFVFDANVTSHAEGDTYRGNAIAYVNTLWKSQFGK